MHKKGEQLLVGEKATEGEKVVYFLHGGSYVGLSAHPNSPPSAIPRNLLARCPSVKRSFAIEYRLSSTDPNPRENPFPAALIDAVAGYFYLVRTVGFDPKDIIVTGDSAGGNLALALVRYLIDRERGDQPNPDGLPASPGALLLLSPWCDVSNSHDVPGSSWYTCAESDYIVLAKSDRMGYGQTAFLGPFGIAAAKTNMYLSPASRVLLGSPKGFKGYPKTFIASGGAEVLRDQIRALHSCMKEEMGDEGVVYYEAEDAVHDYLNFGGWQEPEKSQTFKAIAEWVASL